MRPILHTHSEFDVSPSDRTLTAVSRKLGAELKRRRCSIVTAESCTGGFVAKCLTDIAGSSAWFAIGFVTYSNRAKTKLLGVAPAFLANHGAVSSQTAAAMCRGALRCSGAGLAVAVTGIAGPGGAVPGKPVGTVWFGWALKDGRKIRILTVRERFDGNRDSVRRQSVRRALDGALDFFK